MKLIDRYVFRNFAVSVLVSFCFVVALYLMVHFFGHLEDLENAEKAFGARGLSLFAGICRYYAITLPFILTKLGPFAALLAAMWTIQKLARDQELAAAQVAGISLHRMVAPILVGGAVLSLGLWAVRQQVLPRLAVEHQGLEWMMRGRTDTLVKGPLRIRDSTGGRFSIQTYDPAAKIARGVHYDSDDFSRASDFPAMRYDEAARRWETVTDDAAPKPIPVETDLSPRDIEIDTSSGLRIMASDELDELARRLHGRPDVELMRQTRYTYPFATVVLLLLGLPLVLHRDRQSIYAAWGLCLLLSIFYFAAENVLYKLGQEGLLSPVLAAWVPLAVFGTIGAMAFQDL